jgi:hypothetical protein
MAGCIKYIFLQGDTVHFAVQRQLPADGVVVDPFLRYPYFPARLYSAELSDTLELVHPSWVISHFARWRYSEKHVVVLHLTKVRFQNSKPLHANLHTYIQD